jgi:hypothetical protein
MRRIDGLTISLLVLALTALPVYAAPVEFFATLTGGAEIPPSGSPGTGTAHVIFDLVAHTLEVEATYSGLTSNVTAAHIHCCLPQPQNTPVATTTPSFPGFPSATSGTYDQTFNTLLTSTYNAPFVTANGGTAAGAEAALFAGMLAGQSYFNIHTTQFGGGEIRGILVATPEPGTLLLLTAGVAGVAQQLRRRRRAA